MPDRRESTARDGASTDRPRAGDHYDVLVLGAGWGTAAASLLAKAGRRVAVLEARDRAGGCGHSFTRDGYSFCAEMQYLMGCGPGGRSSAGCKRWNSIRS